MGTTGAGILGNDWGMSCSQRSPKLAGHCRSRKEQRDRSWSLLRSRKPANRSAARAARHIQAQPRRQPIACQRIHVTRSAAQAARPANATSEATTTRMTAPRNRTATIADPLRGYRSSILRRTNERRERKWLMTSHHRASGDAATRTCSTRATIGAGLSWKAVSEFALVGLPAAANAPAHPAR